MLNLLVTTVAKLGEETRAANRELLVDELKNIGKAVHEIIALSHIQVKDLNKPIHAERYKKAADAAKRLKALRLEVRYTMPGLDDGFRDLSRLPDWVGHAKVNTSVAEQLLARAKKLGRLIDVTVQRSYATGRPPSLFARWRVSRAASAMRDCYSAFSKQRGAPALDQDV